MFVLIGVHGSKKDKSPLHLSLVSSVVHVLCNLWLVKNSDIFYRCCRDVSLSRAAGRKHMCQPWKPGVLLHDDSNRERCTTIAENKAPEPPVQNLLQRHRPSPANRWNLTLYFPPKITKILCGAGQGWAVSWHVLQHIPGPQPSERPPQFISHHLNTYAWRNLLFCSVLTFLKCSVEETSLSKQCKNAYSVWEQP